MLVATSTIRTPGECRDIAIAGGTIACCPIPTNFRCMLSYFFRMPCRWCILIIGWWGVEAVCLQNASQEQRTLLNRETGETYPIGLWHTSDYPAARLVTQVVQILVEERTQIGFNQKHIKTHPKVH